MAKIEDIYKIKKCMNEGHLLYLMNTLELIQGKSKAIVNIGVYYGASAAALLLGMQKFNITGPLYCIGTYKYHNAGKPKLKPFRERTDVEWSDDFLEQVKQNLKPFVGTKEVIYSRCFSDDFYLEDIDGISLVFIDADHTTHGCLLDALKYSQKVILGGRMIFHDYNHFQTVRTAIDLFLKIRPDFRLESTSGGLAVLRRIK